MRREEAYRGGRPMLDVTDKTVIPVDDGLATGVSMQAAVRALREMRPAEIIVAAPAAPESTWREFRGIADDVVVATMPTPFRAVGQAYWDFDQTTDDEVRELLAARTSSPTTVSAVRDHRPISYAGLSSTLPAAFRHARCWTG